MGPSSLGECHTCVKKAIDSQWALTRASLPRTVPNWLLFAGATRCWSLRGPSTQCMDVWVCRQTHFYRCGQKDKRTKDMKGCSLLGCLLFFSLSVGLWNSIPFIFGCQDLQRLPETIDNTKSYIYYVFSIHTDLFIIYKLGTIRD